MEPNHRRCISCRRVGPKSTFWRVVRVYPTGAIQLGMGMGRSAYICPSAKCLKAARHKNRLGKALRSSVAESVFQALEARLAAKTDAEGNADGGARS